MQRYSQRPLVLAATMTAFLAVACQPEEAPLRRTISQGTVEGYQDEATGALVWKGIPFARPPVGDLRWRESQDPDPWDGVLETREDPAPCTQLSAAPPEVVGGEDCLYLSVYRPPSAEGNLPVYFWIHGGGNYDGQAALYDLERLAINGNLVAVVTQYRLNAFGYFTHPTLRRGAGADASGNYGTLDQIQSLQWVRDNIAVFGGDPGNVTIAGESAGGHDVIPLMTSPLARGLFHRAVMESGGMASQSVAKTDSIANRSIEMALVMKGLAEDSLQAHALREGMDESEIAGFLHGLSADELIVAHAGGPGRRDVPLANVIEDGSVIPYDLLCSVEKGEYTRVPLMAGVTASEFGVSARRWREGIADVIAGTTTLEAVLPSTADREQWTRVREYGSAFWRAVMLDELVRRAAEHQTDVYAYSFDWGMKGVLSEPLELLFGAAHGMEIPLFQGNVDAGDLLPGWLVFRGFTEANRPGRQALSDAMVAYLAEFVRTGNPNAPASGLPEWKPWTNVSGALKTMHLDADLDRAYLAMGSDELWVADVRRRLDAEPTAVQQYVRPFLWSRLPYAVYQTGDYSFGGCG